MKYKKFVATVISALLLVSGILPGPTKALAKEAKDVQDINKKINLSLDESIEMALENNTLLKIEEEEYEKSKIERSEAKYTSDKIERGQDRMKLLSSVPISVLPIGQQYKMAQTDSLLFSFEGAQGKDLAPRLKEAEELVAKKNLQLKEQDLRIDVERAYNSVLLAEDNLKITKVQLNRANTLLKNAKVSYKQGVVAKDSLLMAEAGVANANSNLFEAQKKLDLAKMNLNKIMGRELTAPLVLTTKFEYNPKDLGDVEEKVQSALKLRPEAIRVREMREVANLNAKLALKYYASNTYVYQKAKVDANKADFAVKEAEDSITLAVRAAYLSAADSIESLKASEKVKKMAKETYRITDLKQKNQVATTADVLEAMEKLNQAELLYTSSVYNYNVAVAELDNWAGKELE